MAEPTSGRLDVYPATSERWDDLVQLFGPRGAVSGCWCMWWRLTRSEFVRQAGEGNKAALRQLVDSGEAPGLLGYVDGQAVAWCSVGPRSAYPTLGRSRTLKPIDEQPAWSIVCFFVARPYRRRGLMVELIRAAVDYARRHGAHIVEGYPSEHPDGLEGSAGFTGMRSAYVEAGFQEVARPSERQMIMRYQVEPAQP
jgi:GNAT superfamily N-acetyltransferase